MHKRDLKKWIDRIMRVISAPWYWVYVLFVPLWGKRKSFACLMQWVSMVPGTVGEWLRRGVLQWVTHQPLTDACISFGTLFSDPDIRIGNGVYIGPRCDLGRVSIGQDTIIGSNVQIVSGLRQHRFDNATIPIRDQDGVFERVSVGRDCWIGSGTVICADMGERCVIGAGSVVVKPVPAFSTAVGNPARILPVRRTE